MGIKANDDQETSIAGERAGVGNGKPANEAKGGKRIFTGFGVAMLFVLVFAIYMYFTFRTVIVRGLSMFPTFKTDDKVLVCKAYWLVGAIKDGDVIVLEDKSADNPDGYIIKRVYKMGGETVDWKLAPINRPIGPFTVPQGMVYVLGDNRPESFDSRRFGPKPLDSIIGKVLANRASRAPHG